MKVLVFVEQRNGKLKSAAYEALAAARNLAGSPDELEAVLVGDGVSGLASELKGHGAGKVYVVEDGALSNYNVDGYTAAVQSAIEKASPQVLLGVASPMGRDIFPRLAARNNAGLLTDLIELQDNGGKVGGVKPMYAGKALSKVQIEGDGLQLVTVRQNVYQASESGAGDAAAESVAYAGPSESRIKTVEVRAGKSEKPDLTEAAVIISGGRSLGSADNFKVLHELSDVIQATVGASRAAVDSGFASHDMQVGQTGKTVNPNLYIACGISGAVQHMAGMRTSKVIVAINTDEEAPIFKVADYGIIGDLFEVVPEMTKQFKEIMG